MKNKKKKEVLTKPPKRTPVTYRLPPDIGDRIKYAHQKEIAGKSVQVSENTFVIHLFEKYLPKIPAK